MFEERSSGAAPIFDFRPWMAWDGTIVPPGDRGNYRFPHQRKRFGFKLVPVDDDDRGRCCLAPLRRSVDADCGQHDGWRRSLDRIFSNRRSLGPNPAGRARYARAWCLVDRCPPIRKKTHDSLIEEAASPAGQQLSDCFSGGCAES